MAKIAFDALTLGEIDLIETLSGYGIGALDEAKPQGKFLAALVMVAKRRDGEPTYTFNQALDVPISEAQEFLGLGDDDPAADAGADLEAGTLPGDDVSAEGELPGDEQPVTE